MDTTLGPIIGTLVLVSFGALFVFVLPPMIRRHNEEAGTGEGDIPIAKWVRILGIIVMGIGLLQIVVSLLL
jgi:hypothetical protein